jgi:hypothetical protein
MQKAANGNAVCSLFVFMDMAQKKGAATLACGCPFFDVC